MTEDGRRGTRAVWVLATVAVAAAIVAVAAAGYVTAQTAAERFVIGLARLDAKQVADTWTAEDTPAMLAQHHTVFGVSRAILVRGVTISPGSFDGGHLTFAVRLAVVPLDPDFQGRVVDVGLSPTLSGWRVVSYSSARTAS